LRESERGGGGVALIDLHLINLQPSGQPVQHAFAKELLAGFAGAEADRLFETKGLDFLDR